MTAVDVKESHKAKVLHSVRSANVDVETSEAETGRRPAFTVTSKGGRDTTRQDSKRCDKTGLDGPIFWAIGSAKLNILNLYMTTTAPVHTVWLKWGRDLWRLVFSAEGQFIGWLLPSYIAKSRALQLLESFGSFDAMNFHPPKLKPSIKHRRSQLKSPKLKPSWRSGGWTRDGRMNRNPSCIFM